MKLNLPLESIVFWGFKKRGTFATNAMTFKIASGQTGSLLRIRSLMNSWFGAILGGGVYGAWASWANWGQGASPGTGFTTRAWCSGASFALLGVYGAQSHRQLCRGRCTVNRLTRRAQWTRVSQCSSHNDPPISDNRRKIEMPPLFECIGVEPDKISIALKTIWSNERLNIARGVWHGHRQRRTG